MATRLIGKNYSLRVVCKIAELRSYLIKPSSHTRSYITYLYSRIQSRNLHASYVGCRGLATYVARNISLIISYIHKYNGFFIVIGKLVSVAVQHVMIYR